MKFYQKTTKRICLKESFRASLDVEILCALETGGKLEPGEAYKQN